MSKVYFVGAGPGDPELLTLRAAKLLAAADVVIYDEILPDSLVENLAAEKIRNVRGEDTFRFAIERAHAGKTVVRLHSGDPTIFGHLTVKIERLRKEGIPYEIVPGVTAATAAAAQAGISLTHDWLAKSVAIVAGNDPDTPIPDADTVVLYMPKRELPGPKLMVHDALRTPKERPVRIAIYGPVVDTASLPLYGQRIVVTRAESGGFDRKLRTLGANVIAYPVIRIEPPQDAAPLRRAVERLADYQWLIFTSANGVRRFFERVADLRSVKARICAIGPATVAELAKLKLIADICPLEYVAEALAAAMPGDLTRQRVLLPRAAVARDVLPETLRTRGAIVDVVEAYRTVVPETMPLTEPYDWITFTSSSTVKNFLALSGRPAGKIASIGPVTTATLRQHGLEPDVEARQYTTDGLVDALLERTRSTAD